MTEMFDLTVITVYSKSSKTQAIYATNDLFLELARIKACSNPASTSTGRFEAGITLPFIASKILYISFRIL
jgi:hypothetical protein